MSTIVLSTKASKLMKVCEFAVVKSIDELADAYKRDNLVPAICMTEDCEYMCEVTPSEREGHCKWCGGDTVMSSLVLAGLI